MSQGTSIRYLGSCPDAVSEVAMILSGMAGLMAGIIGNDEREEITLTMEELSGLRLIVVGARDRLLAAAPPVAAGSGVERSAG